MRLGLTVSAVLLAAFSPGCSAEPELAEATVQTPVASSPPGTAKGYFADDNEGKRIEFTKATALAVDNAEGLSDGPLVRVFLGDRSVPVEMIGGFTRLEVDTLAMEGKIRGMLIEFAPDKPNDAAIRPLFGTARPPATTSLNQSDGLWETLVVENGRVKGTLKPDPFNDMAVTFDAPLQKIPVVKSLKGNEARNSELLALATKRIEAIAAGDFARARQMSSRRAAAKIVEFSPEMHDQATMFAQGMRDDLQAIDRIVIRDKSAIAAASNGAFINFVREADGWKVD